MKFQIELGSLVKREGQIGSNEPIKRAHKKETNLIIALNDARTRQLRVNYLCDV
jgi:hypothetical protein